MEKINIVTSLSESDKDHILNEVYQTCLTDPSLSPRPKKEIINAYENHLLLFAMSNNQILGWLLRIPYSQSVQELAAGYVKPKFRSQGVLKKLIQEATEASPITIGVTFHKRLAKGLQPMGFNPTSLLYVINITHGKFLKNRLHINRLFAIKAHYKKCHPIYLYYIHE